ncbi:CDP-alcohol phosphatidyltransferase family protein [Chitinophagaceae bacterium MMS25-I14]
MKHLPNLLTLANLLCGCIAITFILNAQPFWADFQNGSYWPVFGTEQMYLGSLFIGIAAICDVLDGFTARALQLFSPLGKDLDSLADLVSFGVAPSMILFKMLWVANMSQGRAMDVNMLAMAPAFLIACFGALRLARFNISVPQKGGFTGMPIPAAGIFIASFPLILWSNPFHIGEYMLNTWAIYAVIVLLCWLMVSKIPFIKLMPVKWTIAYTWPQLVLALCAAVTFPFLKMAAVPLVFVLYILLSLIYRKPEEKTATDAGL